MPTITCKFKEYLTVNHTNRAAEIYHRLIGRHYQRAVDSQAGVGYMLSDPLCIGTEWDVGCTPEVFTAILVDIVNNPTIHDMLYIHAKPE